MGKLFYETPEEYIGYWHQNVLDQRAYVQELASLSHRHQDRHAEPDNTCDLCNQFLEAIRENEQQLDWFNNELMKAQKGLYG